MASCVRPRGFGHTELMGSGHIIETDDGETFTTSSMNVKYVLSAFSGFAHVRPDSKMILKLKDSYGREKPIAKAVSGKVSLLILFY